MSDVIKTKARRLAERGAELASELEAGHATAPLTGELRQASEGLETGVMRLALAGCRPEDTSAALAAMVGGDYHVCKIVAPGRMRYFEISLQERGYLLEHGDARMEFDNLESFVSALEKEDLVQQGNPASVLDPVRLKMAAPAGRFGFRLLVPEGVVHLTRRPALMSLLAEQSDWLLVAGHASVAPDAGATEILKTLAESAVGVTCLVDGLEDANARHGWWEQFRGYSGYEVLPLTESAVESLLGRFSDTGSALKQHVETTRHLRQLQSTFQLVSEALDQERTSLRNKQRLQVAGFSQRNHQDQNIRKALDEIKTRLQDDLDALKRSIEDQGKKDLMPGGELYEPLKALADGISSDDLERSHAGNTIRLGLHPDRQVEFRGELLRQGRRLLEKDLAILHEAVDLTVEDINNRAEMLTGFRKKIAVEYPDFQKMWDSVVSLAHPEVRYRGEMPKVTFGARLMSARQGMMWVMMAGMLVTGVTAFSSGRGDAQQIRGFLYALMVPVFLGGLLYSFRSFRDKEKQMLDKESEKLREGVFQELRKVMSEILRQEQSLFSQFFQRVGRDVQTQVNSQIQESEDRQAREKEAQRKQLTEQGRTIDQRLREYDRLQSELNRLQSAAGDCWRELLSEKKKLLQNRS